MIRCLAGAIALVVVLASIAQQATAWNVPCEAVCFAQNCTSGFLSVGCPRCQCAPDPCFNQPCRNGAACRSMPRNCSFTKGCEHVAVCGDGVCGQGCPETCPFGYEFFPGQCPACACATNPCDVDPCLDLEICTSIPTDCEQPLPCKHVALCNGLSSCKQTCAGKTCQWGFQNSACPRCVCAENPCETNPCPDGQQCTPVTGSCTFNHECPYSRRCEVSSCPIDLMIVVDTSSSVSRSKMNQLKSGLNSMIGFLDLNIVMAGICYFGTTQRTISTLTDSLSQLQISVTQSNPLRGRTIASLGLGCANTQLLNSRPNVPDAILLVIDGNVSDPPNTPVEEEATRRLLAELEARGVVIIVLAIGSAFTDIDVIRSYASFASSNTRRFTHTDTFTEFNNLFSTRGIDIPCPPRCDVKSICTTRSCRFGFAVGIPEECPRCTCGPDPCSPSPCRSDQTCTPIPHNDCEAAQCPHKPFCESCVKTRVCTTRLCSHGFLVNVPGECDRCTCAPNPCDSNPCESDEICTSQTTDSCGVGNCPNVARCSPCDKTRVCTTGRCSHGYRINVPGECVRCTCAPNPCDANPCQSDEICTSQPSSECDYGNCPYVHRCSPCDKTRVCTTRRCSYGFRVNVPGECVRCTCMPNPCDSSPCQSDQICRPEPTSNCRVGNCPYVHRCLPCDKTRVCTTRRCSHGYRVNVPGECVRCTCAPNPCDANPCQSDEICTSQPTNFCNYGNCPYIHKCSPCDKTRVCTTRRCSHGYRVNVPGECVRCTCAPNPCDANPCQSDEICTSQPTNYCNYGNCPYIHKCSPCDKSTVCSNTDCQYGFLVDVPGECQRCTCAPDPCLSNPCRSDQICTSRSIILCEFGNCPHEYVCTPCEKDEVCPRPLDPCLYGYEVIVPGECTRCTCAPNPCRPGTCNPNENCIPMPVSEEACGVVQCPYQAFCLPKPCDKHRVCNKTCHFGFALDECPRCTCSPNPCELAPADVCPPNNVCVSAPINCEYGHCPHTLVCRPIPPPQCDICAWARANCTFGVILGCNRCACAPDPCLNNGPCLSHELCVRSRDIACTTELCPHISFCEPMPTQKPTPEPHVNPCDQLPLEGTCDPEFNKDLSRFYYDLPLGLCKWFKYSGCGGNGNRFMTWWDCYRRCMFIDFDSSDSSGFPPHGKIGGGSSDSSDDSSSDRSDGAHAGQESGSSDSSDGSSSNDSDGASSDSSDDSGSDTSDGAPADQEAGSSASSDDSSRDSSDGAPAGQEAGSSDSSDGSSSGSSGGAHAGQEAGSNDSSDDSSSDNSDGAPAGQESGSSDSSDDSSSDSSDGAPAGQESGGSDSADDSSSDSGDGAGSDSSDDSGSDSSDGASSDSSDDSSNDSSDGAPAGQEDGSSGSSDGSSSDSSDGGMKAGGSYSSDDSSSDSSGVGHHEMRGEGLRANQTEGSLGRQSSKKGHSMKGNKSSER